MRSTLFVISLLLCGALTPAQAPPPLLQVNSVVTVRLATGLVIQALWIEGLDAPIVLPPLLPGQGTILGTTAPPPSYLKASWDSGKVHVEVYVDCSKYGKNGGDGCFKEFQRQFLAMKRLLPPNE